MVGCGNIHIHNIAPLLHTPHSKEPSENLHAAFPGVCTRLLFCCSSTFAGMLTEGIILIILTAAFVAESELCADRNQNVT